MPLSAARLHHMQESVGVLAARAADLSLDGRAFVLNEDGLIEWTARREGKWCGGMHGFVKPWERVEEVDGLREMYKRAWTPAIEKSAIDRLGELVRRG